MERDRGAEESYGECVDPIREARVVEAVTESAKAPAQAVVEARV